MTFFGSSLRFAPRMAVGAALVFTSPGVFAQAAADAAGTSSQAVKDEARRRFDRGLALYNAGDLNGALAEFRHAYRLTAHPVVLYNLALVHAGLGHAAEAVDALEKLQNPAAQSELGADRAERARKVLEEQLLRVGSLEIKTDVLRAQVQIDSIDVAKTPSPPLRVTAGTHVVSLSAPQHEPRHVQVTVAGRAVEVLEIQLTPLEAALAHLTPASSVPDVEVRANGELVGKTPFGSDLAFRPGSYELEFSRAGYVPVRRSVTLDPGSVGRIDAAMVP
ncbi:MAG TPA: PEGA domain-containing protein, partial [Polyangiaceae bacterium]|nr:PEGA domain-containing protein [Polyangiaceae bacterium]